MPSLKCYIIAMWQATVLWIRKIYFRIRIQKFQIGLFRIRIHNTGRQDHLWLSFSVKAERILFDSAYVAVQSSDSALRGIVRSLFFKVLSAILSAISHYGTLCEIQVKNFLPTPRYVAQQVVDYALCSICANSQPYAKNSNPLISELRGIN
jgi:hypothetical protein